MKRQKKFVILELELYHQQSPCRVVKKDRCCYDQHSEANKLVKLSKHLVSARGKKRRWGGIPW